MSSKEFLSGNQSVALACKNFGIEVAAGYPGTPSTSILEFLAKHNCADVSWYSNEKVALEVCIGASFCGARCIATMKHVGLNVAADPLMTLSYTGTAGALVIITCDDPGSPNSQNEQDNRNYAKFAKIPLIEPSTPQECYEFFRESLRISEKFQTPILFRMTTKICNTKDTIDISRVSPLPPTVAKFFRREEPRYVMLPSQAIPQRMAISQRLQSLKKYSAKTPLNHLEISKMGKKTLLVTSGFSYLYAKEMFPDASVLKLGFVYPLQEQYLQTICKDFSSIICVEELDPFLEETLLLAGIPVRKKEETFHIGEFSGERVERLVLFNKDIPMEKQLCQTKQQKRFIPPPSVCSGCPHMTILHLFHKMQLNISGDIGCYTMGASKPYFSMHAVVDMGASIPMSIGMRKVVPQTSSKKKIVAVIGDSTFFHTGIQGLIDAVQQRQQGVICILDNGVTAMTGGQGHPGGGKSLSGLPILKIDYQKLLESIGVTNIVFLDPYKPKMCELVLQQALEKEELSVLILQRVCAILEKTLKGAKVQTKSSCVRCGDCLRVGCPSLSFNSMLNRPHVDIKSCIGCGVCAKVCQYNSIGPVYEEVDLIESLRIARKEKFISA